MEAQRHVTMARRDQRNTLPNEYRNDAHNERGMGLGRLLQSRVLIRAQDKEKCGFRGT